jgi:L-lactate dehydrogenase
LPNAPFQKPTKVSVIGTGRVGSTYAYTLLLRGTADEICLINDDKEKALGESMDLNHAMSLVERTTIWAGSMHDVADSDLVVISAGSAQKPGETRMDLITKNAAIVGDIAERVGKLAPNAILLVVTNPVDVMSYVALARSGLPRERVIGSGTVLDTARLRYVIGDELGINPQSIHASVIGEHGDSEIPAWSRATIAGTPLRHWALSESHLQSMFEEVRDAAYHIINLKGATFYAIAVALAKITESILRDLRSVYSVSCYIDGEYGVSGVYLGTPAVVGREGILRVIELPLSPEELAAFKKSAEIVKQAIQGLNLKPPAFYKKLFKRVSGFDFSGEIDVGPGHLPPQPSSRLSHGLPPSQSESLATEAQAEQDLQAKAVYYKQPRPIYARRPRRAHARPRGLNRKAPNG